jgi:hypothetical protein
VAPAEQARQETSRGPEAWLLGRDLSVGANKIFEEELRMWATWQVR